MCSCKQCVRVSRFAADIGRTRGHAVWLPEGSISAWEQTTSWFVCVRNNSPWYKRSKSVCYRESAVCQRSFGLNRLGCDWNITEDGINHDSCWYRFQTVRASHMQMALFELTVTANLLEASTAGWDGVHIKVSIGISLLFYQGWHVRVHACFYASAGYSQFNTITAGGRSNVPMSYSWLRTPGLWHNWYLEYWHSLWICEQGIETWINIANAILFLTLRVLRCCQSTETQ